MSHKLKHWYSLINFTNWIIFSDLKLWIAVARHNLSLSTRLRTLLTPPRLTPPFICSPSLVLSFCSTSCPRSSRACPRLSTRLRLCCSSSAISILWLIEVLIAAECIILFTENKTATIFKCASRCDYIHRLTSRGRSESATLWVWMGIKSLTIPS